MTCPLCSSAQSPVPVKGPDHRFFNKCEECSLIYADDRQRLSVAEEKERYLQHNNGREYPGYVKFLERAILPGLKYIDHQGLGLDLGCGPVPTLSELLKERGIECEDYDPLFFPIDLSKKYDFIFATECFEHFFFPAKELENISGILKDNGVLIVMTEMRDQQADFSKWYYARDPSHVVFYSMDTFRYIAAKYDFEIIYSDESRVMIMKKKSGNI